MDTSDSISLVSALFSAFAIVVAYHTYRGSVRAAVRPVLIFSMSSAYRWQVQNVGAGPAINVIVADCHPKERPHSVTNCYPLAAGGTLELSWIRAGWQLVAVYTDVGDNIYTTVCAGNRNRVSSGNAYPHFQADTDQWLQQKLAAVQEQSPWRESDLEGKTEWELDVLRNEPYARQGYIFERPDLSEHFSKMPWYQPDTNDQHLAFNRMTPQQQHQVTLILDFQRRRKLGGFPRTPDELLQR